MSQKTNIEWTRGDDGSPGATWNPVAGCEKIGPGCAHCYAIKEVHRMAGNPNPKIRAANEGLTRKLPNGILDWTGVMRMLPDRLTQPLKTRKPTRYFVNSLSDLFHKDVPFEYIAAVYGIMAACADRELGHVFQILTKRSDRAVKFYHWLANGDIRSALHETVKAALGYHHPDRPAVNLMRGWPLPNVWFGNSVAVQKDADENIPHLLQIPAAVRFLSVEPMVGPVSLQPWLPYGNICVECAGEDGAELCPNCDVRSPIDWVIVGGESGHGARPCNVEWIRSIVAQCKAAGVPVFVKQLGAKPITKALWLTDSSAPYMGGWPLDVAWTEPGDGFAHPVLLDPKGGDWNEWPKDLRIREFPEVSHA